MLNKEQIIVYFKRDKFQVYQVRLGKSIAAKLLGDFAWKSEDLPKAFAAMRQELGVKSVRVLVDDSVAYLLVLDLPKDGGDKRKHLADKLAAEVPEELSDSDWDFVEVVDKEGVKKAVVFAPVKSFWKSISQASLGASEKIEAIEPVSWAKKRHENPVIGLALKTDLKGKDGQVLNLVAEKQVGKSEDKQEAKKKSKPTVRFWLWLVLGVMVILALVVGGILVSRKALEDVAPVPDVVASPSAQVEEFDLSKYRLQILNGSGLSGEDEAVKEILAAEGFASFDLGGDEDKVYELTEIRVKAGLSKRLYDEIERALNSDYGVKPGGVLTDEDDYDVVIVVGEKL